MPRLKDHYYNTVVKKLMKELNCSIMQVPAIKKITLNMGVGEAANDKKVLNNSVQELTQIAGQKAVITKTRKSIAGFKIRADLPIGCKVTLRKDRMYDFLDKLLSISIPRIRDFRGLNKNSFDQNGNYSFGIEEQIVFPEIKYDKVDTVRGLDICITTSARNKNEGLALLQAMNFPFR